MKQILRTFIYGFMMAAHHMGGFQTSRKKRVFLYLFQEYLCLGFERKNFYES